MEIQPLENNFSILKISKTKSSDYQKALKIYNDVTPHEIKTLPDEITSILSSGEEGLFESFGFILYYNEEVKGFALLSYLLESRAILIEYIALEDSIRTNSSFLVYLGLLQRYMSNLLNDITYWIVEISNKDKGKSVDKESRLFKNLIRLENFGKLNAKYYTPPIGTDNYESSFEAFIYVRADERKINLSKKTYLQIIESIYNYSKEWFKKFNSDIDYEKYSETIKKNLESIEKFLKNDDNISIEYYELENIIIQEETAGRLLPIASKSNITKNIAILIIVMFVAVLLIPIIGLVLKFFDIKLSDTQSIIGGILSAVVGAILVVYLSKKN